MVSIDRRTVLKAALVALAAGATGEIAEGCETDGPAARKVSSSSAAAASTAADSAAPSTAMPSAPTMTTGVASASASSTAASASSTAASSTATATATASGAATEIVHGPASATGVALTFHGAGDPALATQLLGIVEAADVRITVLAVGSWLEQNPQLADRILAGGHDLGNHTYHHLTMPSLSAASDDAEIAKCADVLRKLTGSQGRWFRPSGTTRATPRILAAAARGGYAECLSFDVDPLDYTDPGAATVAKRVLRDARAGSIVSMHFGHAGTVQAMPTILEGLRLRSLSAVSMSAMMQP
jgi:peptidoglycan/xylan/chitin deacetylase (PgdA/CDA1 family)